MFIAVERIGNLAKAHGAMSRAVVLKDGRVEDRTPDIKDMVGVGREIAPDWLREHGVNAFRYDGDLYQDAQEDLVAWAWRLSPRVMVLGPHRLLLEDPAPWRDEAERRGEPFRYAESDVALFAKGALLYGRRQEEGFHERTAIEPGRLPIVLVGDRTSRVKELEKFGVTTFRDAWKLSGEDLGRFFGGGGGALMSLIRGEASIFVPAPPPPPVETLVSLRRATGAGDLLLAIREGAENLSRLLGESGDAAKKLGWRAEGQGWVERGEVTLLRPSADGRRLGSVLGREIMTRSMPEMPERLTLVVLRRTLAQEAGGGLFGRGQTPVVDEVVEPNRREVRLSFFDPLRQGRDIWCHDFSLAR